MRLGDLDELKKQFANECLHNCYYCKLAKWDKKGACYNCGLIDNAPTVDTDEIYKKGYHNGFFATHDVPPTVEPTYISDMPDDKVKDLQELAIDYGEGIAVFERKRPLGKWKVFMVGREGEKIINITYHCSECGRSIVYIPNSVDPDETTFLAKYPFCHCGAEMRGEKE